MELEFDIRLHLRAFEELKNMWQNNPFCRRGPKPKSKQLGLDVLIFNVTVMLLYVFLMLIVIGVNWSSIVQVFQDGYTSI